VAEIVISIFSFLVSFSLNIHVVGCATTKEDGGQFHYPIVPKELKLGKKHQKVIGKPIPPKCPLKWDTFYEKQLSGNQFGIY
jgi:hypothetical protein